MASRILITGAAGFLGSHLCEYLLPDFEVFGIDNESIGQKQNVPQGIHYAKMDMRNPKDLAKVIEECQPNIIFHTAAWAHEGLSQFAPRLITENNYNIFLNLIIPAISCEAFRRIIVFSSMSVYGSQVPPFNEKMKRSPEDIYAVAKTAMEQAVEILADVHDFEYTIVRPHNVYGPKQALHDPYRNVVGIFCNRVLKGQPPIIYGDGRQTRAFSYVDDVTPYIAKLATLPEANGEIFNIGPTEEYSVNALAGRVVRAFGYPPDGDYKPIHVPDRPREVREAYCTNAKAQKMLGYKTSTSLSEGIRKTVEWARSQGPKDFKYLDELELQTENLPETWRKHTI